jgi:hypothetical protein
MAIQAVVMERTRRGLRKGSWASAVRKTKKDYLRGG